MTESTEQKKDETETESKEELIKKFKYLLDGSIYPETQFVDVKILNPSDTRGTSVKMAFHMYGKEYLTKKGPNNPLVFVQGFNGTKKSYGKLPFHLSKNRLVIALDNRGIGESLITFPNNKTVNDFVPDITFDDMADDCVEVMKHVFKLSNDIYSKFDIVGQSMGGIICNNVMIRHGNLVNKGIILDGGPCGSNNMPIKSETHPILGTKKIKEEKTFGEKVLDDLLTEQSNNSNKPPNIKKAQWKAAMKVDLKDKIQNIKNTVLIVHGKKDTVIDYNNAIWMNERIENSYVKIIKDKGHILQYSMDGMKMSIKIIDNFLTGNL